MKTDEFMGIVLPVAKLVELKSGDYPVDASAVTLEQYFPFGHKSYAHMVWTKGLRLRSLVASEKVPTFEGVEDTVDDMIAYLVFYKKYLTSLKK